MGKKIKRQPKSFLQKEHEEDEEREAELIQQEKSNQRNASNPDENENIIANNEEQNDENLNEEQEEEIYSEDPSINLVDEISEKINSIKNDIQKYYTVKNKNIDWLEFPVNISESTIPPNLNPDDDIKRELIFYNIAKENAIKGMIQLKQLGEKINRPDDYFVEMLKSDEQMENIKKQIIREQTYIKNFEQKKQKFQNIKFAKSIKDFQNKEKSSFKKKNI
jgi:rRNA-processing protein EBP2